MTYHAETVEACIAAIEAQKRVFASDEYATPQPVGSVMERFACDQAIAAIRALPNTPANESRLTAEDVADAISDAFATSAASMATVNPQQFADFLNARLASTPAPDSAPCRYCQHGQITGLPGNACENCMNTGLENGGLTATMTRGLPSGTFDDATYEQIEAALDAADAPSIDKGNWLKLHERVAALAASRATVQG